MALTALLVSIGAILISAISVWYAHRADSRAVAAEKRAVAAEGRDTERLERERAESDSRLRARIGVESTGGSGSRGMAGARYGFRVRNIGQAPTISLWLWLRDTQGRDVSTRIGGQAWVLAPGDPAAALAETEVREAVPLDDLVVWVSWTDEAGDHEEASECRPQ